MGAAENKELVRRYLAAMRAGDPGLPDLLSDEVSWWVPPSSAFGGTFEGKQAVLALMARGIGLYDTSAPMELHIEEMVAEGELVCVQLVIEARTARGEPYRNHYHFAFRVRDGRICAVKEYVDTLYAQRKLFPPD
jgi:ketosteroid isomerase-like protein